MKVKILMQLLILSIFSFSSVVYATDDSIDDGFCLQVGRTFACLPERSKRLTSLGIDEIRGFTVDIEKPINKNFSIEISTTQLRHWDDDCDKFCTETSKQRLEYDIDIITSLLRGKYTYPAKFIKPYLSAGIGYVRVKEYFTYITDYTNRGPLHEQSQTMKNSGVCIEAGIGLSIYSTDNFSVAVDYHYFKGYVPWLDLDSMEYVSYTFEMHYYF